MRVRPYSLAEISAKATDPLDDMGNPLGFLWAPVGAHGLVGQAVSPLGVSSIAANHVSTVGDFSGDIRVGFSDQACSDPLAIVLPSANRLSDGREAAGWWRDGRLFSPGLSRSHWVWALRGSQGMAAEAVCTLLDHRLSRSKVSREISLPATRGFRDGWSGETSFSLSSARLPHAEYFGIRSSDGEFPAAALAELGRRLGGADRDVMVFLRPASSACPLILMVPHLPGARLPFGLHYGPSGPELLDPDDAMAMVTGRFVLPWWQDHVLLADSLQAVRIPGGVAIGRSDAVLARVESAESLIKRFPLSLPQDADRTVHTVSCSEMSSWDVGDLEELLSGAYKFGREPGDDRVALGLPSVEDLSAMKDGADLFSVRLWAQFIDAANRGCNTLLFTDLPFDAARYALAPGSPGTPARRGARHSGQAACPA